jgi:hypothetical protein
MLTVERTRKIDPFLPFDRAQVIFHGDIATGLRVVVTEYRGESPMNVSEHGALERASSFAVGCAWCLLAASGARPATRPTDHT